MTGALASDLPWPLLPPVLLLPCALGAQLLLWPDLPATLALTPHTVTLPFPALTGAFAADPCAPFPPVLPLLCDEAAQPLF